MDLRKHNGNKGHSTKAKGIDKRKNQYKDALADALDVEDVANVLRMLYTKSIEEKDTNASKILLEYYLVKKATNIDANINTSDDMQNDLMERIYNMSDSDIDKLCEDED